MGETGGGRKAKEVGLEPAMDRCTIVAVLAGGEGRRDRRWEVGRSRQERFGLKQQWIARPIVAWAGRTGAGRGGIRGKRWEVGRLRQAGMKMQWYALHYRGGRGGKGRERGGNGR
jgi:hypothetical protein